jgi:hypothetical protein
MSAIFRLTKATRTVTGMLPASSILWVEGKEDQYYIVKSCMDFKEYIISCDTFDERAIRIN